jgi:hypothetical protein
MTAGWGKLLVVALLGYADAEQSNMSRQSKDAADPAHKKIFPFTDSLDKWDGKVFGVPTYAVTMKDLVEWHKPPQIRFGEVIAGFHDKLSSTIPHVIDWWKVPFFSKFNTDKQVFWPQSSRDKCNLCKQLIGPSRQFGILSRFAPMLTDGNPNLYSNNYVESFQMEWLIKRCPTYLSDMCYRPDGFGFTLQSPCPDTLICSACLGIPATYCVNQMGPPHAFE